MTHLLFERWVGTIYVLLWLPNLAISFTPDFWEAVLGTPLILNKAVTPDCYPPPAAEMIVGI